MSNQDSFFDDPLDEYKPKPKFPFDDRPEDDWSEDVDCSICSIPVSKHTMKELVDCAIMELRYPKNREWKRGEMH